MEKAIKASAKNAALEAFKIKILFDEIHRTERSNAFSELCDQVEFFVRHKIQVDGVERPYILFFQLAGGVVQRELLIELCQDLKQQTDWRALHLVWNEGDETYYENIFMRETEQAKKLMVKLRPVLLEYTSTWSLERKQSDLAKPEGKFLKGWYLNA